jgi:hypothetical protein
MTRGQKKYSNAVIAVIIFVLIALFVLSRTRQVIPRAQPDFIRH